MHTIISTWTDKFFPIFTAPGAKIFSRPLYFVQFYKIPDIFRWLAFIFCLLPPAIENAVLSASRTIKNWKTAHQLPTAHPLPINSHSL